MVGYVYSFNPTEIINGTLAIFIHIYDKPHAYRDQYFSFLNLNFLYRPTRIYSEIYHGWWDLLSPACYVSRGSFYIVLHIHNVPFDSLYYYHICEEANDVDDYFIILLLTTTSRLTSTQIMHSWLCWNLIQLK